MAAEDIILGYLKQDGLSSAGMAEARTECAETIAELGKRLRGEA